MQVINFSLQTQMYVYMLNGVLMNFNFLYLAVLSYDPVNFLANVCISVTHFIS